MQSSVFHKWRSIAIIGYFEFGKMVVALHMDMNEFFQSLLIVTAQMSPYLLQEVLLGFALGFALMMVLDVVMG